MINISLIKTVLLCFMLVFIYGNSFSQEFEQSVIPEIICEAEGSDESESKESPVLCDYLKTLKKL